MQAGGVPVTGDGDYVDPRWRWPEYPEDSVVEVRVHGVGGEGPEGMTRDPHPVRVGGDDGVGFWRARNPEVPGSPGHVREVVSWGGSTSGHQRSAFWVLLLPFALFNAAGRMAPAGSSRRRLELHQAVCRLLALSMTLAIVALTAGVALDLFALQCSAVAGCADAELVGRWLLAPLRWLAEDAAALVALLALLPALVPYLLRVLGRRGLTRISRSQGDVPLATRAPQLLDEPDFWRNRWPAWRLRGLHITTGYAWVVVLLGLLLPPLLPGAPGWLAAATWIGVGSVVGNAVVVALPRTAGTAPSTGMGRAVLVLRWVTLASLGVLVGTGLADAVPQLEQPAIGIVATIAGLAAVTWSTAVHVQHVRRTSTSAAGPSGASRDAALALGAAVLAAVADVAGPDRIAATDALGALPDGGWLARLLDGAPAPVYAPLWALVVVQVVLLVLLVATSRGRSGSTRSTRGPLPTAAVPANLAAPVVALLSLLLVTAVGSSVHGFLLDWLGRRVPEIGATPSLAATPQEASRIALLAPREAIGLALPWWQSWTALTVVATVVVLGATVVVLRQRVRANAPPLEVVRAATARTLEGPPDDSDASTAVLGRTRQRWLDQVLVERAGRALGIAVGVLVAAVVVVAVVAFVRGTPPGEPLGATLWLSLVALIPPAVVGLIRNAREDRLVRRQIAALWDVLAFWPRVTHPFSPPSYGEALVPAVTARVAALRERFPVVLAGHSQGSVVALAAILHARPGDHPGRALHLVTYGTPVRSLYEGFFPTVFGGDDGAIARGTPTAPWDPAGPSDGHGQPATWHNVLGMAEPLGTPLWHWSVPGTTAGVMVPEAAWAVHLQLPWASCPVCGWSRPLPPGIAAPPTPTPPVAAIDVTITDPDRIVSRAGEVDGLPLGHSAYHRSREFDDHLATLVSGIRARSG